MRGGLRGICDGSGGSRIWGPVISCDDGGASGSFRGTRIAPIALSVVPVHGISRVSNALAWGVLRGLLSWGSSWAHTLTPIASVRKVVLRCLTHWENLIRQGQATTPVFGAATRISATF